MTLYLSESPRAILIVRLNEKFCKKAEADGSIVPGDVSLMGFDDRELAV